MLGLAALGMAAKVFLPVLWHQELELRSDVDSDVIPSAKSLDFLTQSLDKFSTAITRSTNDIQQIQLLTVMILRIVLYAPIMAIGGI